MDFVSYIPAIILLILGFGLVVLPEPGEIDIERYVEVKEMEFADKDKISTWAKDAVAYCVSRGFMQGKGENFDPKAPITREEFCVVLQRVMEAM